MGELAEDAIVTHLTTIKCLISCTYYSTALGICAMNIQSMHVAKLPTTTLAPRCMRKMSPFICFVIHSFGAAAQWR